MSGSREPEPDKGSLVTLARATADPAGIEPLGISTPPDFEADLLAIDSIEAVPTILEVVCRTTGMGFAAVARVTDDRWIACSVKDDIAFGLKPGG